MDLISRILVLVRRWYVVLPILAVGAAMALVLPVRNTRPYTARATLVLVAPAAEDEVAEQVNPYLDTPFSLNAAAQVLATSLRASAAGIDDVEAITVHAIDDPPAPLVEVIADAPTSGGASEVVATLVDLAGVRLDELQAAGAAPPELFVSALSVERTAEPRQAGGGRLRPMAGIAAVAIGLAVWIAHRVDRRRRGVDRAPPVPTGRPDAAIALSAYVVLLLGIPPVLVIGPLGAPGAPAALLALGLAVGWLLTRLLPQPPGPSWRPIRLALGAFVAVVGCAYVAAGLRGYDGVEQRAADRGLLVVFGVVGVALVAADGLRTRERVDLVLRWLVRMGAAMAVIGFAQFQVGFEVAGLYRLVPLLSFNSEGAFLFDEGIRRAGSTSGHPIEFGMVLTLILPIAVHQALYADPERKRRAWSLAGLVGLGIPLSISRSAVVGLALVGIVLLAGWPPARRVATIKVLPLFLVAVRLLAPGSLGTLRSGLLGIQNDPSFQGRTEDYAVVGRFIGQRPWFGRGFGTFLPDRYVLLDNQYLGVLIELGGVGLATVIALLVAGFATALAVRLRSTDAEQRDLGLALAASIAAAVAGMATFDAFGFAQFTGVLFLLLGCIGALWRLSKEAPEPTPDEPSDEVPPAAVPGEDPREVVPAGAGR